MLTKRFPIEISCSRKAHEQMDKIHAKMDIKLFLHNALMDSDQTWYVSYQA